MSVPYFIIRIYRNFCVICVIFVILSSENKSNILVSKKEFQKLKNFITEKLNYWTLV